MLRVMLRATIIATLACASGDGRAETFHLRTGGRITGDLLNPEQQPRTTYNVRLSSGGDVTLDAKDVRRVEVLSEKERRYEAILRRMPADTAENHWVMAEWCRKQGLTRERKFHLEQVISHEPDHEDARRALKYKRKDDGTWARVEEIFAEEGLVYENGRWLTAQEIEIAARREALEEAAFQWKRDIRMWRGWLGSRRHQQAVENLGSIDDPLAAPALVEWFWEAGNIELREELAKMLGRLDSSVATNALIRAALEDRDADLRVYCVKQLRDNNRASAIAAFVARLGSKDNGQINRAASALRHYADDSAILPLIQALRTDHQFKVGDDSGRINAGFNRNPGSRGFGNFSMGNSSRTVTRRLNNKSVRSALIAITDQDFQFNEAAWKRWYLARTTPAVVDLRRDP